MVKLLPHESSVRVPVLSKTMMLTLPALLTADGAMQYIPFFLSLSIANKVPVIIARGRVGGTKVVIRFNQSSITSQVLRYLMNLSRNANHSTIETTKHTST
jgi:hypothetical protein